MIEQACLTDDSGTYRPFDLNKISNGPKSQTHLILGCGVQGKAQSYSDPASIRTYKKDSQHEAAGHYKEGKFTLERAKQSSLDAAAALQEAYAKLNSTAVAKFLIAVAGLISPELV